MSVFAARFPGKCKACNRRFKVGTMTPNPAPYNGGDSADRAEADLERRERDADDFEYAIGYSHGLDCSCAMCADFDARTY